jgi:hypothetical protein
MGISPDEGKGAGVTWLPGTVLFASDDSDESVTEARVYCAKMGYGSDVVKIVKRDNMVLVVWR